ncbi:MAG: hypothetical protein ACXWF8_05270 [Methylobacter sp.]
MNQAQSSHAKNTDDILALYEISADVLLALLDDPAIAQTADRRTRKALELVGDATQALHAACTNLALFTEQDDQK